MEILLEDIRGKFELVLEGDAALRAEIHEARSESNDKQEQTAFLLKAMNAKIDSFREESNDKHDQTASVLKAINGKLDAVAADLSAHRTDTEAHLSYKVRD